MATSFKHIEMVGRLAKNEEVKRYESDEGRAVFINKPGDIQYKIKRLSDKNGVKEETFTGYMNSIRNLDFVDDEYGAEEERIEEFTKFYTNTYFLFSHKVDNMGYSKIDVADIVPYPSKINDNSRFIAIPCFSGKSDCDMVNNVQLFRTYETYPQFLKLLLEGRAVGRIYNFQIDNFDNFPEFIIWSDSEKMCAIGPVRKALPSGMDNLMIQINPAEYCEVDLDDESEDTVEFIVQSDTNPTLLHITEEKYLYIVNKMSRSVPLHTTPQKVETAQKEEVLSPVQEQGVAEPEQAIIADLKELPAAKNEAAILEFFRYHSHKNKLFYADKDVLNFHTAIKTGGLVILSGMSGTGKSALVDTYAKALGVGKDVLIIPVRPSWNDDSDLLGYVDLIHMVYRPSDTGFINKIVEASRPENKEKLYLICLDEMNLARVEHYFSQFLSILEKPMGSRELVLYDEQYAGQLYNSLQYPQRVSIGDNVKFIGTVNIDESTYHFSDKVLDRANIITLGVLNYSKPENWKEDKYRAANTPEWSNVDYNMLIKKEDASVENQCRIREFLWEMHTLLHVINANLGVGPRIVKSIEMYLRNLPEMDPEVILSAKEGLDYQVTQRILTKIRGPEEQIKELFQVTGSNNNSLMNLFNAYTDISDFERCRRIIKQKEKELRVYGYCL